HLLSEQALGADQANARLGKVPAEDGQLALMVGANFHRLYEVAAALLAAFALGMTLLVLANELVHRRVNGSLVALLLPHPRADEGLVIVSALPKAERRLREGDDFLPLGLGHALLGQLLADFARQHVALARGPADDGVGHDLQIGWGYGHRGFPLMGAC